jgi:hypothetical protein
VARAIGSAQLAALVLSDLRGFLSMIALPWSPRRVFDYFQNSMASTAHFQPTSGIDTAFHPGSVSSGDCIIKIPADINYITLSVHEQEFSMFCHLG